MLKAAFLERGEETSKLELGGRREAASLPLSLLNGGPGKKKEL